MKACLVVCRSPSGLSALRHFKSERPVIVASDDPRVQEAARAMPGIVDVTYIEKCESVWTVATEVKAILRQIDEWLVSLDPSVPREAIAWGTNIEGGFTGQRVQDALLLVRSYLSLFATHEVEEVHAVKTPGSGWEDTVLRLCAEARSLPFARHASHRLACWKSALASRLIPWAKAGYYIVHEVLLGGGRLHCPELLDVDGAIVFQLCSSLDKHVDNIRHVMSALSQKGEKPVALCWSAGERIGKSAVERIAGFGLVAEGLERYVTLRGVLASLWRSAVTALEAYKRRGFWRSIHYEGVSLAPLFKHSLSYFFIAMLPQRLRYARALTICLSKGEPVAIKPWGGADLFEGKLALRLLQERKKPIYVHYWLGAGIAGWPYGDLTYRPDLFLAKSRFEADLAMREYTLDKADVEVVGQARFAPLRCFDTRNTPQASRRALDVPGGGTLYVGLDPNAVLPGYQSYREQVELVEAVLRAARRAPGLVVAIKPHPNCTINHLLPLIQSYENKNVVVLPKHAPVEHFLNCVDLVLTKFSTLILEAAIIGRCVIAAILDGEDRFRVFGDLPAVLTSGADVENLLVRLASDSVERETWKRNHLARQADLIPQYYFDTDGSHAAIAANTIIKRLQVERCRPMPGN